MGTGEAFVKWLRPAGCVLFLGLFIIVTVFLFTSRGAMVEGYEPPQGSEYYREHPEELLSEVRDNLLTRLEGVECSCALSDGVVVITAPEEDIDVVRDSVTHYYDEELFRFQAERTDGGTET